MLIWGTYLCFDARTFERWGGRDDVSNTNKMMFENGAYCWNGPIRSMEVELVCGETLAGVSVFEPNKCEYFMTVKTPAACGDVPATHGEL